MISGVLGTGLSGGAVGIADMVGVSGLAAGLLAHEDIPTVMMTIGNIGKRSTFIQKSYVFFARIARRQYLDLFGNSVRNEVFTVSKKFH
jgi:hypothetical protein